MTMQQLSRQRTTDSLAGIEFSRLAWHGVWFEVETLRHSNAKVGAGVTAHAATPEFFIAPQAQQKGDHA